MYYCNRVVHWPLYLTDQAWSSYKPLDRSCWWSLIIVKLCSRHTAAHLCVIPPLILRKATNHYGVDSSLWLLLPSIGFEVLAFDIVVWSSWSTSGHVTPYLVSLQRLHFSGRRQSAGEEPGALERVSEHHLRHHDHGSLCAFVQGQVRLACNHGHARWICSRPSRARP